MTNFKKETYDAITESGHKREDVMFIGSLDGKYRLSMDEFDKIADFEYYSGFGSQEIADDLIIYFNDHSYFVRGEYDGSEWWEYNRPLIYNKDDAHKTIKKLKTDIGWDSVEDLNKL